jgi:hypothetical protein
MLIRSDSMRDVARRSGYSEVTVVPIEHSFWRFYRFLP